MMMSPFGVMLNLFNELPSRFPQSISTIPFYIVHGLVLCFMMRAIRRRGRQVRESYLAEPQRKAV